MGTGTDLLLGMLLAQATVAAVQQASRDLDAAWDSLESAATDTGDWLVAQAESAAAWVGSELTYLNSIGAFGDPCMSRFGPGYSGISCYAFNNGEGGGGGGGRGRGSGRRQQRVSGKTVEDLEKYWYSSTYGENAVTEEQQRSARAQSLSDHWAAHGRPEGKTLNQYVNDALGLWQRYSQTDRTEAFLLDDGTWGWKIVAPDGQGGFYSQNGLPTTFWYPGQGN